MKRTVLLAVFLLSGASARVLAASSCERLPTKAVPGCEWLPEYIQLAALESGEQIAGMKGLYNVLCKFPQTTGSTVYYPNGRVATYSAGTKGATLYYPNGQTATYAAGMAGATWYYPSGQTATYAVGTAGATLYYPNGQTATYAVGTVGATWYYPKGQTVTYSAGTSGATWYYDSGRVLSYSMGSKGATWYYPNGNVWTHSGPEIEKERLLDVPGFLCELADWVP